MADRKLKIWQKKKKNPRHLERDTFCALSECSLVRAGFRVNRLQKASGKSFKTTTSHPVTQ